MRGGYGRFGASSRVELERFFHLDDEDRRLIAARRRDYNRLGLAVQVVTVCQAVETVVASLSFRCEFATLQRGLACRNGIG
jgi:hypothetical protein